MSENLQQLLDTVEDHLVTSGNVPRREWKDRELKDFMKTRGFLNRGTEEDSLNSCKAFLNFYTGDTPDLADYGDLLLQTAISFPDPSDHENVLPMINKLPSPDTVPVGQYSKLDRFSKTRKTTLASDFFRGAEVDLSALPGTKTEQAGIQLGQYDSQTNALSFYKTLWDGLESQDKEDRSRARTICSFLALVLVRILSKSASSIRSFLQLRQLQPLTNMLGPLYNMTVISPHHQVLKKLISSFTKGSITAQPTLAHILWFHQQNPNNPTLTGFLTAGCLLHLKYNGMGILNAASTICKMYKLSLKKLFIQLAYQAYETSLITVLKAIKTMQDEDCSLFPWCRVLSDSYHNDLSSLSNKPIMECLLFVIKLKDPDQDVWRLAPWNGTVPKNNFAQRWAELFIAEHDRINTTRLHEGALEIGEINQDYPSSLLSRTYPTSIIKQKQTHSSVNPSSFEGPMDLSIHGSDSEDDDQFETVQSQFYN